MAAFLRSSPLLSKHLKAACVGAVKHDSNKRRTTSVMAGGELCGVGTISRRKQNHFMNQGRLHLSFLYSHRPRDAISRSSSHLLHPFTNAPVIASASGSRFACSGSPILLGGQAARPKAGNPRSPSLRLSSHFDVGVVQYRIGRFRRFASNYDYYATR